MWRDHTPCKTSLLPCLRTRRTPNPLRWHQIWGRGASQRERPRNTGWRANPGPMGEPDRSDSWRQFWRCWRGDLETSENRQVVGWRFLTSFLEMLMRRLGNQWEWTSRRLVGRKLRRKNMSRLATINRDIFFCLSSRLAEWWARRH